MELLALAVIGPSTTSEFSQVVAQTGSRRDLRPNPIAVVLTALLAPKQLHKEILV